VISDNLYETVFNVSYKLSLITESILPTVANSSHWCYFHKFFCIPSSFPGMINSIQSTKRPFTIFPLFRGARPQYLGIVRGVLRWYCLIILLQFLRGLRLWAMVATFLQDVYILNKNKIYVM
jgi:hypothetical protein